MMNSGDKSLKLPIKNEVSYRWKRPFEMLFEKHSSGKIQSGARDWTTLACGKLSLGCRFGKENKFSFRSTPTKDELRSRLISHIARK